MWVQLALIFAPMIFDLIYGALKKKYGLPVLEMASANVATLEEQKVGRIITSDEAERINVALIQRATRMSPPIPKTIAKLINLTCYGKYIQERFPEKFKSWIQRITKWEKKGRPYKTTEDFSLMGLYIDPKHRRKS